MPAPLPEERRQQIRDWIARGHSIAEIQALARAVGWTVSRGTVSNLRQEVEGLNEGLNATQNNPVVVAPSTPTDDPPEASETSWKEVLQLAEALVAADPSPASQLAAARITVRAVKELMARRVTVRCWRKISYVPGSAPSGMVEGSEVLIGESRAPVDQHLDLRQTLLTALARLREVRKAGRPRIATEAAGLEGRAIGLLRALREAVEQPGIDFYVPRRA